MPQALSHHGRRAYSGFVDHEDVAASVGPRGGLRRRILRRVAGRLVLAAAAIVATSAVVEFALRALGLPRIAHSFRFLGSALDEVDNYVADERLFWRFRPGLAMINVHGLRGHLPERLARRSTEPRSLRIACVGDSCTYGVGVRYEETYGMVLEGLLRRAMPGRQVETMLAGVPGYSTHQSAILVDDRVVPFGPDVTIFYCGAWNDFTPAIGECDRDRGGGLRLLQLLRSATVSRQEADAERERIRATFAAGRIEGARRVGLADFRRNMTAMFDAVTAAGSRVVVILPHLESESAPQAAIAAEYRAELAVLARDRGFATVDPAAAFAAQRARVAAGATAGYAAGWPCYEDWVHPSALGHELLGTMLFDVLRGYGLVAAGGAAPAPMQVAAQPTTARHEEAVTLRGDDLGTAGAFERLFLGKWWVEQWQVLDATAVRLVVPPGIPAGEHEVSLVGPSGTRSLGTSLVVPPPRLDVTTATRGDGLVVQITCSKPSGWRAGVMTSTGLRDRPTPTQYGAFALAAEPDGRPPDCEWAPFVVSRLTLDHVIGASDTATTWEPEIVLDAAALARLPDAVHLQCFVVDPAPTWRTVLTAPATVRTR